MPRAYQPISTACEIFHGKGYSCREQVPATTSSMMASLTTSHRHRGLWCCSKEHRVLELFCIVCVSVLGVATSYRMMTPLRWFWRGSGFWNDRFLVVALALPFERVSRSWSSRRTAWWWCASMFRFWYHDTGVLLVLPRFRIFVANDPVSSCFFVFLSHSRFVVSQTALYDYYLLNLHY